jgi:hypothetical protein
VPQPFDPSNLCRFRWRTIAAMAYDQALADRIRELVAGQKGSSRGRKRA